MIEVGEDREIDEPEGFVAAGGGLPDDEVLSDAGRQLFQASRAQRTVVNDADRLRKYLGRFGLDWDSAIRAER